MDMDEEMLGDDIDWSHLRLDGDVSRKYLCGEPVRSGWAVRVPFRMCPDCVRVWRERQKATRPQ